MKEQQENTVEPTFIVPQFSSVPHIMVNVNDPESIISALNIYHLRFSLFKYTTLQRKLKLGFHCKMKLDITFGLRPILLKCLPTLGNCSLMTRFTHVFPRSIRG